MTPTLLTRCINALARCVTTHGVSAVLLFGALAGCGPKQTSGIPDRFVLRVDNRGFFDVTVYAVRSPNSSGIRLGNVSGGSTSDLRIRFSDLQPGQRLAVRVRALGTNNSWFSPTVPISSGAVPRLNVVTSATGALNQSALILESAGNDH